MALIRENIQKKSIVPSETSHSRCMQQLVSESTETDFITLTSILLLWRRDQQGSSHSVSEITHVTQGLIRCGCTSAIGLTVCADSIYPHLLLIPKWHPPGMKKTRGQRCSDLASIVETPEISTMLPLGKKKYIYIFF